jgi:hypothetical protein
VVMRAVATGHRPGGRRVAARPGVPVEDWHPYSDGRGAFGRVASDRGPIITYRGFGSWGEARDSLAAGEWRSKGMFNTPREGDTQMALDLNDVLHQGAGVHRLRGTGFLGFIEVDIAGLPIETLRTKEPAFVVNPVDPTRGTVFPDTGLGIGVVGGIPLDRIRRVVAINEDGTWEEMSIQELRSSIDHLQDREGWEPEVKDRPETHRFVILYGSRTGRYHRANPNQDAGVCGEARGQMSSALVRQGDLMDGRSQVKNYWSSQTFTLDGRPCPKCFPWASSRTAAATGHLPGGRPTRVASAIPPRPGTVPVPSGKVRCSTIVGAIGSGAPAEVIRRDGLRIDLARSYTDQFGSFQAIWANTGPADKEMILNRACVVEFAAPAEEVQASAGTTDPGRTVTFARDIPPSEFLYVYEPWHAVLWLLQDDSGWDRAYLEDPENDWTWKENPDPGGISDEAWRRGMEAFREMLGMPAHW